MNGESLQRARRSTPAAPTDVAADAARRYLTVNEVAAIARCEHKSVRRAIHLGQLRAFQPANKLLILEQDAHLWIQSRPPMLVAPLAERPSRLRRPVRPSAGSVDKLRAVEQQLTLDGIMGSGARVGP
jgi:hypothetical protein